MPEFKRNDGVLTVGGEFKGWVGYFLEYDDKDQDTARILVLSGDGEAYERIEFVEYLMNLENLVD